MQQVDQLNALLNSDLSEVPTDRPLLNGLAKLKVKAMAVEPNKAKDASNLNCQFALVEPMTAQDGRAVNPGFVIFHTISLKVTEKYNPQENLAKLREAITGSKTGSFAPVEQYLDMEFMAKLKPQMDEEFGNRTVIGQFVKKG
jgi:hypothetical protein